MITVLKNSDGFVEAYLEWQVVDEKGQFKNLGEYCYIQDFWIHPSWRDCNKEILKDLSWQIAEHPFSKNMKWVYWNRHKYNDRISKIYPKEKFLKGDKHGVEKVEFATSSTG